jgi:hypothetical protein
MIQRSFKYRIEIHELLEKLEILAKTTVDSPSHIGMLVDNRYEVINKLGDGQVYQVLCQIDKRT